MNIYVHIFTHIYAYTHEYTYTYIYINMYIYIYLLLEKLSRDLHTVLVAGEQNVHKEEAAHDERVDVDALADAGVLLDVAVLDVAQDLVILAPPLTPPHLAGPDGSRRGARALTVLGTAPGAREPQPVPADAPMAAAPGGFRRSESRRSFIQYI